MSGIIFAQTVYNEEEIGYEHVLMIYLVSQAFYGLMKG